VVTAEVKSVYAVTQEPEFETLRLPVEQVPELQKLNNSCTYYSLLREKTHEQIIIIKSQKNESSREIRVAGRVK